ncbi:MULTISPECIES: iron ABC transporter permease [Stenotrophomonas]|uniref:ABC transporter permease n=1 Tax=Stenotrophomonas TaxID=40323 RepID=UPI00076FF4A4|nr:MULTISPECIES: iron ABC transporter permease [Stenotrophomonas]AMJ55504.1 iron ABC transporter permease [Stenotrophomonas sp. KCTC 12332]
MTWRWNPWLLGAVAVAALMLAPVLGLAWAASDGSAGLWSHLWANVLPTALLNTGLLLLGVGLLVGVLGTGSAWLVTAFAFPGRRLLSWALLLPLAVPTYIAAFAYLDVLHPLGPVQGLVRDLLGYDSPRQFRLPDIRHLGGCIVLLGFVLYPYVYLTTRALFMTQAAGLLEAARSLGATPLQVFWRVALPLARPAIAVGVALALLETLNDIGASEFLGVQTLTVSIYTTWVSRGDLAGAAQIALAMLLVVALLLALERHGRRRQRYASVVRPRPLQPQPLRGGRALLVLLLVSLPVLLGFVVPAAYLLWEAIARLQVAGISPQLLVALWNTVRVALMATCAAMVLGLLVAWALRLAQARRGQRLAAASSRIAALGYAIPGTVLAIGLLLPLGGVDAFASRLLVVFGGQPQMLLMGSVSLLVLAYTLRFLAVSVGGIESGLARIPLSLDQAAANLGERPAGMLRRVHLPLLRPALAAAALLVFVDTMKELSATLVLRPMNFETLATWLYAEAARGTYEEGAVAALLIVISGLLPVILLARAGAAYGVKNAR